MASRATPPVGAEEGLGGGSALLPKKIPASQERENRSSAVSASPAVGASLLEMDSEVEMDEDEEQGDGQEGLRHL